MNRAQAVATRILAIRGSHPISTVVLTSQESKTFQSALIEDSRDGIYSAALSICEAVQGLDRQMFTWPTVKLYYSVFFLARSALSLSRVGLIYEKTKPYIWKADAGQTPKKTSGNTHKAILNAFAVHLSNSPLLSQLIVSSAPFDWLASQRESVNYKIAKFSEPDAPTHFKVVEKRGVRRMLGEYLIDDKLNFTFDPDHAMLAFPVATLKETMTKLRTVTGAGLSKSDCSFVGSQCFDKQGPIAEFRKFLSLQ